MTGTLMIAQTVFRCADWLGERLVALASEALTAHEDRNYSLAVSKCGSCLEGILTQLLTRQSGAAEYPKTLGPLVGAVRDSKMAPSAFLERLNEACVIRNRASHLGRDTGGVPQTMSDGQTVSLSDITEGDSLQILHIIALTAHWCGAQEGALSPALDTQEIRVFLSLGSPHRLDQGQFVNGLRSHLRSLGVRLVSLSGDEYSPERPFDQIRELMTTCRATLVVGLDRSHAYAVFERENSRGEVLHQDQFIPTAWNQIEGSIAAASGMEVLILRERRLHREGIFEAGNHRHQIRDYDLAVEAKALSANLRGFLMGWVDMLRLEGRKSPADDPGRRP